jgi:hypothetical protein
LRIPRGDQPNLRLGERKALRIDLPFALETVDWVVSECIDQQELVYRLALASSEVCIRSKARKVIHGGLTVELSGGAKTQRVLALDGDRRPLQRSVRSVRCAAALRTKSHLRRWSEPLCHKADQRR